MIVAGTGHRPDKLVVGNINAYDQRVMQRVVALAVAALRKEPPDSVIAGGALGFDEALAHAAVEAGYPLRLFLPFPGYDARWPRETQARYGRLARQAAEVRFVTPAEELPTQGREPLHYGIAASLLDKRNHAMVDACGMVLALWNGERKGGTWNCLRYAAKSGRPTRNLWASWERHSAEGLAVNKLSPGRQQS